MCIAGATKFEIVSRGVVWIFSLNWWRRTTCDMQQRFNFYKKGRFCHHIAFNPCPLETERNPVLLWCSFKRNFGPTALKRSWATGLMIPKYRKNDETVFQKLRRSTGCACMFTFSVWNCQRNLCSCCGTMVTHAIQWVLSCSLFTSSPLVVCNSSSRQVASAAWRVIGYRQFQP